MCNVACKALTFISTFVCASFYEYLLKVWIQGNKTEVVKHYRYIP